MGEKREPRYPVYIPSKGRADNLRTAWMFQEDDVPYKVVVEPQEVDEYAQAVGRENLLTLPKNNKGLVYSRNWIKNHATEAGHKRHWQFDDDIFYMNRVYRGYRLRCPSNVAMIALEDFVDRYENVALASFNSEHFIPVAKGGRRANYPPFYLNHRCYTVFLILNEIENQFRHRYNEDADMTLQVLANGWCTVLLNAFLIKTPRTMSDDGGQTDIYVGDGRLQMSRQLERVWPGVVTTKRRFQRPQHKIKGEWKYFDTPLKRREDVDWEALEEQGTDEYGLRLVKKADEVKNDRLKDLLGDA